MYVVKKKISVQCKRTKLKPPYNLTEGNNNVDTFIKKKLY